MKHVNVSLFVPHLGCPHSCIFCNQNTISGQTEPLTKEEIIRSADIAAKCEHDINSSEIAFFGGSFTAIKRSLMIEYLETAKPYIGRDFGGIRLSTRPDCIDDEILALLKSYGVTAIELGAQSMCQEVLDANERGHTPEDTIRASKLIKDAGFSLGLQMMTGLYMSNDEKDIYTAECFTKLKPDTVRVYPTVVLENTKLCRLYREGKYIPQTLETAVPLCARLLDIFDDAGIKVIRMGLHSGGNVEDGYVAGAYHPAFRELCEGEAYRRKTEELLKDKPAGAYTVYVNPREISKAVGQKKCNCNYFMKEGKAVSFKGLDSVPPKTVTL